MQLDKKDLLMRLMIVDDFTNMRRTIKNMLRQIGFERIEEADDGDTAMDKLGVSKIDFVVCDWNMPRMPGINLLRFIRSDENLKQMPFLMVTAENWEEEISEAAEESVDGYIIKPFVTKTLEDKIVEILDKRRNPSEGEKLYQEAMEHYDKEELDDAKEKLDKILLIKPNSAKATHMLGQIAFDQGDLDKADQLFNSATEHNKRYVKAYHSLAEISIKKNETDKAIKYLEEAIAISPRISHRQLLIGQLFLQVKKIDKAADHLKKGIEMALQTDEVKDDILKWLEPLPQKEKDELITKLSLTK